VVGATAAVGGDWSGSLWPPLETPISIRQFPFPLTPLWLKRQILTRLILSQLILTPLMLAPASLGQASAVGPPAASYGSGEPSSGPDTGGASAAGSAGASALPSGGSQELSIGPYALTPRRRALLATIRYAEGTWTNGSARGYQLLYGGGHFSSLSRHPQITVRRRYVSAAAGAYQFLPPTWNRVAHRLGLRDFGPRNQDMAALYLVERRGVLATLDREGLNGRVLDRLAREWASLPNLRGASVYGQPVKTAQELQQFYASSLQRAISQPDSISQPAAIGQPEGGEPDSISQPKAIGQPAASPETTG
jgi:muramidase (phage lysozyme)